MRVQKSKILGHFARKEHMTSSFLNSRGGGATAPGKKCGDILLARSMSTFCLCDIVLRLSFSIARDVPCICQSQIRIQLFEQVSSLLDTYPSFRARFSPIA